MLENPVVPCPGTILVHRDGAVTCTRDRCGWAMPRDVWFQLHAGVVRCADLGPRPACPHCRFEADLPAVHHSPRA